MTEAIEQQKERPSEEAIVNILLYGDIGKLTMSQRAEYLVVLAKKCGLNPATKPFDIIPIQGGKKLIVYANKSAAAQIQANKNLTIKETYAGALDLGATIITDVYMVKVEVTGPDGRVSNEVGVVSIFNLKGEDLANAIMRAHTKAHRRGILMHEGLGFTDESELDTMNVKREVTIVPNQAAIGTVKSLEIPLDATEKQG